MLEVCIDSLESANSAIIGGADEIEICSALPSGGLTPSPGLVYEVLELVKKLPAASRPKLNAMIRCSADDDFVYSDSDMDQMLCDLRTFKKMGVDGFVFGALTTEDQVDESTCIKFLNAARANRVTFSRAFEYTWECKRSAGVILGLGFHRILTSGHRASVNVDGAIENLAYLTNRYRREPDLMVIMPGGGVTSENVHTFINLGSTIVHSSCKSAVKMPEHAFKLGATETACVYATDADRVREMKEAIANAVSLKELEEQKAAA